MGGQVCTGKCSSACNNTSCGAAAAAAAAAGGCWGEAYTRIFVFIWGFLVQQMNIHGSFLFLIWFIYLAVLGVSCGMWESSFLTRNRTWTPGIGSTES